jgi:hypothetical protein
MKKTLLGVTLAVLISTPVFAQQEATEAAVKRFVPYTSLLGKIPDLTLDEYNAAVRELVRQEQRRLSGLVALPAPAAAPSSDESGLF